MDEIESLDNLTKARSLNGLEVCSNCFWRETVNSLRELGHGRRRRRRRYMCAKSYISRRRLNIHWCLERPVAASSPSTSRSVSTCSGSKSDLPRRLRRDSAGSVAKGPAARHQHPSSGTYRFSHLFRCYCPFKKRQRYVCGSWSVKNRVRVLPLQEATVAAAPAAARNRHFAAVGLSYHPHNHIKSF